MKVKICGITRLDDARRAADLGADFIGFIFVPESPRCITFEAAAAIAANVRGPKFVGVFRDAPVETMQQAPGDYLQLHGSESDDVIRTIGRPAIKAFPVDGALPNTETSAEWVLFDSPRGGSGRRFDWSLLAAYPRTRPFLLAGGITPENVALAISTVRPDAIDVASGVESSPGIKDPRKLEELFKRVK